MANGSSICLAMRTSSMINNCQAASAWWSDQYDARAWRVFIPEGVAKGFSLVGIEAQGWSLVDYPLCALCIIPARYQNGTTRRRSPRRWTTRPRPHFTGEWRSADIFGIKCRAQKDSLGAEGRFAATRNRSRSGWVASRCAIDARFCLSQHSPTMWCLRFWITQRTFQLPCKQHMMTLSQCAGLKREILEFEKHSVWSWMSGEQPLPWMILSLHRHPASLAFMAELESMLVLPRQW